MKRSRITGMLAVVAAAALTAVSCQKGKADQPSPAAGEKVSISISGDFTDLTETGDTKASVQSIFRMTWAGGEKVYVYGTTDGTDITNLGELTAAVVGGTDGRDAELSGTITAPATDTKLTLVYSPEFSSAPALSSNAISVDLSTQTGTADAVTFVAYATVPYNGTASSSYRTSFKFATSVLRVNASNLAASTELTKATLGTIETTCKLTIAANAEPAVAGDNATGTITRTLTSCSANAQGSAAFYVAVPKITENVNRALTVFQGVIDNDAFGFATGAKAAGNLMNSIAQTITTGQHGVLNGQEYVIIKAKYDGTNDSYLKWATQNLAVTASGKAKWNGTNYVIGDYFQWAASYAGYGLDGTTGKEQIPANLVIYTSFVNTFTTSDNSFAFKDSKQFNMASAPYGGTSYTKYNDSDKSTRPNLEQADDVANIVLGSTWRMPTIGSSAGEITAMSAVTYWAWDGTDKGYYVFKPGVGTSGAAGERGTYGTGDDKTKALLFFPATGNGNGTTLWGAGSNGHYWSSSLSSGYPVNAYVLDFNSSYVDPYGVNERCYGYSVRPVSD